MTGLPATPLNGSCRRQQRAGVDTAPVRLNLRLSLGSAENRQADIVHSTAHQRRGFGAGGVYLPESPTHVSGQGVTAGRTDV